MAYTGTEKYSMRKRERKIKIERENEQKGKKVKNETNQKDIINHVGRWPGMPEGKQKDRIIQINKKQINEKDQKDKKVNSGEEEMDNVKKT